VLVVDVTRLALCCLYSSSHAGQATLIKQPFEAWSYPPH